MTHNHRPHRQADGGDRRRRLLALGAGGLVLGIGATAVFAAWTDRELAGATFAAGEFGIQGSATGNGTDWADHPTTALTISFDPSAQRLSPGDTAYAPYAIKLADGSDYAANVTLANATVDTTDTAFASALSYSIVRVPALASCSASASGTADAGSGGLVAGTPTAPTTGGAGFTLDDPTSPAYLCVKVTANGNGSANPLPQGATGTITWTFTAESGDPI